MTVAGATPSSVSGGNTGRETIVNAMPSVTRFVFDLNENLRSVIVESSVFGNSFTWYPTLLQGKSGKKDDRTQKFKDCLAVKTKIITEDFELAVRQGVTAAALIILVDAVGTVIALGFETAINAHAAILPTVVIASIGAVGATLIAGKAVADAAEKASLQAQRAYESCKQETGYGYEPPI